MGRKELAIKLSTWRSLGAPICPSTPMRIDGGSLPPWTRSALSWQISDVRALLTFGNISTWGVVRRKSSMASHA